MNRPPGLFFQGDEHGWGQHVELREAPAAPAQARLRGLQGQEARSAGDPRLH